MSLEAVPKVEVLANLGNAVLGKHSQFVGHEAKRPEIVPKTDLAVGLYFAALFEQQIKVAEKAFR